MELETTRNSGTAPAEGLDYLWFEVGKSPLAIVGFCVVILVVLVALLAPWLAPHDPYEIHLDKRLLSPSLAHWAGTDELGRDLLSRIVFGTRASLSVALGIVVMSATVGTLIGSFSGIAGGRTDTIIMRMTDVVMSLPGLVIALAFTAAMGPGLVNVAIALGALGVPYYTRIARGQTLSLRHRQYTLAARTMGASSVFILRRHIVRNLLSIVLVVASMHVSGALLAAAALNFIGLGAQPPTAELGALINNGRTYIQDEWWYSLFPGVVIVVAALGFNLLGDGMRDLLDPKARRT